MKKTLFYLLMLLVAAGCSSLQSETEPPKKLIGDYEFPNYNIQVYEGSALQTKTAGAEYYTLTSDVPGTLDLIIENIVLENGYILQKHYVDSGEQVATMILDSEGRPLQLIRNAVSVSRPMTKAEDGDGFWDCMQEAYDDICETIEESFILNAICNSTGWICEAVKIYVAYIDCCTRGIGEY